MEIIIAIDVGWKRSNTSVCVLRREYYEILDYGILIEQDANRSKEKYYKELGYSIKKVLEKLNVLSIDKIYIITESTYFGGNVKTLKSLSTTQGILINSCNMFSEDTETELIEIAVAKVDSLIGISKGVRGSLRSQERKKLLKEFAMNKIKQNIILDQDTCDAICLAHAYYNLYQEQS